MPFDREFLKHLHDVMAEVSIGLSESEAKYKSELVWKAQKTNNAAAMPGAYKDAALHAMRTRFEQTVERYFQALGQWGIIIDDAVEKGNDDADIPPFRRAYIAVLLARYGCQQPSGGPRVIRKRKRTTSASTATGGGEPSEGIEDEV